MTAVIFTVLGNFHSSCQNTAALNQASAPFKKFFHYYRRGTIFRTKMKGIRSLNIGTSGCQYDHWYGVFYPEELNKKKLLNYYSRHLDTVEINSSFYSLPRRSALLNHREEVPKRFIFSVKASRYITHMKKLTDPRFIIKEFFRRIEVLDSGLGPVLFQLPTSISFICAIALVVNEYFNQRYASGALVGRSKLVLFNDECRRLRMVDEITLVFQQSGTEFPALG